MQLTESGELAGSVHIWLTETYLFNFLEFSLFLIYYYLIFWEVGTGTQRREDKRTS